jgi:hypothetical protein
MLTSCTLIVAASLAAAQAKSEAAPAFSLADLECFVGEWEGKTVLPEGADLWAPWKGEEVSVTLSWKWVLDKKALASDWQVKTADKVISSGKSLWFWDPSRKKLKAWWLDSLGRHGQEMWAKAQRGNKWNSFGRGIDPDGKALSGRHTIRTVDENTHVHEWTNGKVGDEPQPDMKIEYKRVKR